MYMWVRVSELGGKIENTHPIPNHLQVLCLHMK